MNTKLWKSILNFVPLSEYPNLPCPFCHHETLKFDEDTIISKKISKHYEKIASRHFELDKKKKQAEQRENGAVVRELWNEHPLWGIVGAIGVACIESAKPNYHFRKFTAFMYCTNCEDNVAVTGLLQQHTKKTDSDNQEPSIYKIDHFSTPVSMFKIDEQIPSSIQLELLGAFRYFHIDTNSSANKLRRAIECFCNEFDIPGDNLARRLAQLKEKYPTEVDLLNTLRLVGNEGSHSNGFTEVNEDDLLGAFDIVEEVLTLFPRLEKLNQLKRSQEQLINKFDKKKVKVLAHKN